MINGSAIEESVREAYTAVADGPRGAHPFPVGREFAASLGYPADLLAGLPDDSVAAFTGVTNLSVLADLRKGENVLDLGCGAGLDALVAAGQVGPDGMVDAVDFSEAMLRRARTAAREAGATQIAFRQADARDLPLGDDSVDVALVNGILNLNPDRNRILRELARVVRPGGSLWAAELVRVEPGDPPSPSETDNWFA